MIRVHSLMQKMQTRTIKPTALIVKFITLDS